MVQFRSGDPLPKMRSPIGPALLDVGLSSSWMSGLFEKCGLLVILLPQSPPD